MSAWIETVLLPELDSRILQFHKMATRDGNMIVEQLRLATAFILAHKAEWEAK